MMCNKHMNYENVIDALEGKGLLPLNVELHKSCSAHSLVWREFVLGYARELSALALHARADITNPAGPDSCIATIPA